MNVISLLKQQAQERPDQPAIIDGSGKECTFSGLEASTESGAAFLAGLGLCRGDSVLVFVPMSLELYEILLAIFRTGLVAMFVDPSAGTKHLEQSCSINPPAAFVGFAKAHLLLLKSAVLRRIPRRIVAGPWLPGSIPWSRHRKTGPSAAIEMPDPDSPALLTFTSGSTGLPKAAVRTHRFLLAQHGVLKESIKLKAGEIDLATLPMFVLANLASGITSVIPDADLRSPGRINAIPILHQIARLGITRAAASPAFFERLAEACERTRTALPSFQQIYTGGAPVFPNLLQRLQRLAPAATITSVYGSTEAEPIAHIALSEIQPEDFALMSSGGGLLAGRPVPEIEVCIIRDRWGTPLGQLSTASFQAAKVPNGEIGEIVVTGDHVLKGYFQGKGNQETKFDVEGSTWHRTGDAGYLDTSGRLWLMGRCAARVNDSRGTLYPFSVECVAQQYQAVRRCGFVGYQGRRILVVELAHGQSNLPSALGPALKWAQLDDLRVVHEIPVDKRHNAKIDYPRLKQMLTGAPKVARG